MAPRLALLLLLLLPFAGRVGAQLSCASEEELVANLRWVREVCEDEGEAFPEGDEDTLVPSAVTTAGCAEVVHRVAESCDGLLSRSEWFASRQSALMAAAESASAAGLLGQVGVLLGSSAQRTVMIADPDASVIRSCGTVLEDGFEQFSQVLTGMSRSLIDIGASCGQFRLAFDDLTLDKQANDNLRLYTDSEQTDELMSIFHVDLPLAEPISIPGSVVSILLISDGASRRTSLRATVECVESPCQNGGTCTSDAAPGVSGGGHRRAQATGKCTATQLQDRAAVVQAQCCGAGEDCSDGVPNSCDTGCAAVLPSFVRDCSATLAGTDGGDVIVTQLQSTVALCPDHQCSCADEWQGVNCDDKALSALFPNSQLITPEDGATINSWISGGDPNQVWERCFSSFEDDSSTPAAFHERCDPYDVTVSVARNSLGYTFGGFAMHSWGIAACCIVSGNECIVRGALGENGNHFSGFDDLCIDHTSSSDFIFRLSPGAPQSFSPIPGGLGTYQVVSANRWPVWGNDLSMGGSGIEPGGSGRCDTQGSTYAGSPNQICGDNGYVWRSWGATELEVWRLGGATPQFYELWESDPATNSDGHTVTLFLLPAVIFTPDAAGAQLYYDQCHAKGLRTVLAGLHANPDRCQQYECMVLPAGNGQCCDAADEWGDGGSTSAKGVHSHTGWNNFVIMGWFGQPINYEEGGCLPGSAGDGADEACYSSDQANWATPFHPICGREH